ncbi:hypothetical protein BaRGS_00015159 [Batillaria attramentaria]|uniref:TIR domain-containing protein n=1 Tax=Batillaria attramentaria TaxID=370345 RepID=A0ABD0L3N7_9CAEN
MKCAAYVFFFAVFGMTTHASVLDKRTSGRNHKPLLFEPEWKLPAVTEDQISCNGSVCGDGFCCCLNNTALCTDSGLTYVPRIPNHITTLDFSNNSLNEIDGRTFENVTFLLGVRLDSNNVSTVQPDAFLNMTKLQMLRLRGNRLTDFKALATALKRAVMLEHLDANDNLFKSVDLGVLAGLQHLRNLTLYRNSITHVEIGSYTEEIKLEELDIGTNLLSEFPDFCKDNDTSQSHFPHLKRLNIEWNKISDMHAGTKRCLPSLTFLKMDGNAIYHIERNFLQGFTRLTRLSLQFCMARIIDSHAFNHSTIQHLDVSENLWFFDKVHGPGIHPGLFLDMPDLKSINMSWTVFRFSDDDEREQVLSSVSHVEAFTLEGTGLSFIPSTILSEFRNLTYLNFGKNEITFLPDDTFENLTSLRVLDLSKNHLTTISQNLLQDVVSRRYISDNIIEKMQESGTILPVLSNAFLKSEWCRFELFVAVKSGLAHAQRRVPLVPLLLENLDRSAVDSFVSALLNTTTYLAWPQAGGEEERGRFWGTLCEVLAKNTGRELRQFPPERHSR